jgi:hypothetical protein
MGLLGVHKNYKKKLFAVNLKHSSFWVSADVKLMSDALVNAMPLWPSEQPPVSIYSKNIFEFTEQASLLRVSSSNNTP